MVLQRLLLVAVLLAALKPGSSLSTGLRASDYPHSPLTQRVWSVFAPNRKFARGFPEHGVNVRDPRLRPRTTHTDIKMAWRATEPNWRPMREHVKNPYFHNHPGSHGLFFGPPTQKRDRVHSDRLGLRLPLRFAYLPHDYTHSVMVPDGPFALAANPAIINRIDYGRFPHGLGKDMAILARQLRQSYEEEGPPSVPTAQVRPVMWICHMKMERPQEIASVVSVCCVWSTHCCCVLSCQSCALHDTGRHCHCHCP